MAKKKQTEEKEILEQEGTEQATATKKSKKSSKKEQSDQLKEENEALKTEIDELKDKYLRVFAEFDNYKRRAVKEKLEMMKTAAQDTLSALLPVLDDFDRAKKNAEDDNNTEQFSEGVTLVYNKLYSSLSQKGLTPMESTGEDFDPELHEALTEIPAPTEEMKGKIIDTIEKGYYLNDKIIS